MHMARGRSGGTDRRGEIQPEGARQQVQRTCALAIHRIAQNGMAKQRTMHAHLMCSPAARREFQPRDILRRSQQFPIGHRRLASLIGDHAPAAASGLSPQRRINRPGGRGGNPAHNGPVDFVGPTGSELGLRGVQRRPAQRDQETARCVGIQPMHQPGPVLAARQSREPILDTGSATRSRMHRQACRFVQHHKAIILEQDRRHRQ